MATIKDYDKQLKPCPFCGKKVRIWHNDEYRRLEIRHVERTDECPMYKTWLYDTEDALVKSWNKRVSH
jgi:hypothetical protein